MAAGDILQGRRLPDSHPAHEYERGDFGRVKVDGGWVWRCRTPSGALGNLEAHDVVEHADGSISVSPSILVTTPSRPEQSWHGYLERGVWREV